MKKCQLECQRLRVWKVRTLVTALVKLHNTGRGVMGVVAGNDLWGQLRDSIIETGWGRGSIMIPVKPTGGDSSLVSPVVVLSFSLCGVLESLHVTLDEEGKKNNHILFFVMPSWDVFLFLDGFSMPKMFRRYRNSCSIDCSLFDCWLVGRLDSTVFSHLPAGLLFLAEK